MPIGSARSQSAPDGSSYHSARSPAACTSAGVVEPARADAVHWKGTIIVPAVAAPYLITRRRVRSDTAVSDQAIAQAAPLRVNEPGAAVLPVWVAWKPMLTDALAAISALWDTFLAVTCPEVGA